MVLFTDCTNCLVVLFIFGFSILFVKSYLEFWTTLIPADYIFMINTWPSDISHSPFGQLN